MRSTWVWLGSPPTTRRSTNPARMPCTPARLIPAAVIKVATRSEPATD
jgi:hypothetical protein